MCEIDFHTTVKKPLPQCSNLLALSNGVGGYECNPYFRTFDKLRRFYIPCANIIKHTEVLQRSTSKLHIRILRFIAKMFPHKRRVAHDVTDMPGGHNFFPVNLQRIAANNG